MKEKPPKLDSREEFALWVCEQHNLVNEKLMKPQFNCTLRRLELKYGRKSHRVWGEEFKQI
jgi:FAD-linked sulfhydryl oxidase